MAFTACSDDDFSSQSIITTDMVEQTPLDKWLEVNYLQPYNIEMKYRYEFNESNADYYTVPAEYEQAVQMAHIVKYSCVEAYDEVAGIDFTRRYFPKLFFLEGEWHYRNNGTFELGTAEGGLKITFYVTNWLVTRGYITINYNNGVDETDGYTVTINSMDDINYYFLHTAHHEFGHILNQNKAYPTDFNLISQDQYVAQWNTLTDAEALPIGFISAYASSQPGEDFVEVLSYYITSSDEEWNARLDIAGTSGAAIIERKLNIVKNYMADSWNIDLDELRSVLARRYEEVESIDWSDF